MKTATQIAKEVIDAIPYVNIATITEDGRPWNSAVWYARDGSYNLFFVSPTSTVHAHNIALKPECFVTIYDSTAPEGEGVGVYIEGLVTEVKKPTELMRAIACLYKAKQNKRQITEFISLAPRRIYKITPTKMWVNDAKEEDGLYLDYRVEVPLGSLTEVVSTP